MVDLARAWVVESLVLDEKVAIIGGDIDPSTIGQTANIGDVYIRTDGTMFQKTGVGDTDWEGGGKVGTFQGLRGSTTQAIDYAALDKVLILVDTTTEDVTVTLPPAAAFINYIFHVKWIAKSGTYKCIVAAQTGETIDGDPQWIHGELYDSYEFVSNGSAWYVI